MNICVVNHIVYSSYILRLLKDYEKYKKD